MSFALLALASVRPAAAQNPGGGWAVTDKAGNAIAPNQDGSGYPLRGPLTGSKTLTGTYPDELAAASQPNPTLGFPFTPSPMTYQNWLYGSGSTGPGGGYNPYAVWAQAGAGNNAPSGYGSTPLFTPVGGGQSKLMNGSATVNTGGTLWAIFQWSGSQPPPVDHLDLLLTTTVSASASASPAPSSSLSATATAMDTPFNETATASADGSGGGVPLVKGKHLLRVPVAGGAAQVSLSGTTTAAATNNVPYGAFGTYYGSPGYFYTTNGAAGSGSSASVVGAVAFDSREVSIRPPLGTTYHKGPNAQPVPNAPDPYTATLTDDTVVPPTGPISLGSGYSISYQAVAGGSWNANSSYAWSQRLQGANGMGSAYASGSAKGTLPSSNITPPFSVTYGASSKLMGVAREHVSILVTDSGDGATASDDYFLNFHNPFDGFVILNHGTRYGSWVQVTPTVNSGPNGGVFPTPVTVPVSFTPSATPGGPATDFAVGEVGLAGTMGLTFTSTVPRPPTAFNMPRNASCYVANRVNWQHSDGTVDSYGPSGYTAQTSWAVDQVLHTGSSPHLIDYEEQLISTTPPPGG